jgi:hypothetical protein
MVSFKSQATFASHLSALVPRPFFFQTSSYSCTLSLTAQVYAPLLVIILTLCFSLPFYRSHWGKNITIMTPVTQAGFEPACPSFICTSLLTKPRLPCSPSHSAQLGYIQVHFAMVSVCEGIHGGFTLRSYQKPEDCPIREVSIIHSIGDTTKVLIEVHCRSNRMTDWLRVTARRHKVMYLASSFSAFLNCQNPERSTRNQLVTSYFEKT